MTCWLLAPRMGVASASKMQTNDGTLRIVRERLSLTENLRGLWGEPFAGMTDCATHR